MQTPKRRLASMMLAVMCGVGLLVAPGAEACTGIRLIAEDGTVVAARTLEFGIDLESNVILIPRGHTRTAATPDGRPGRSWTAKYASLGANALGMPIIVDGFNERGLGVGLFYFPTSAKYLPYVPADASRTVAPWELGSYILENFATTEEVRAGIADIVVPDVVLAAWKFVPPVHYVVYDAGGRSIVIEYAGGKLNVHDNPLGVMTNAPTYDWHMTNLRNYLNFSLTNAPPVHLGSITLMPFGQGSGMLGLPGDFTPPSRFVRAAAFSHAVLASKTGEAAVLEAFHILNAFDIPKGAARQRERDEHGNIIADYTLWTGASDLKAKRYYFRTYDDSQIPRRRSREAEA